MICLIHNDAITIGPTAGSDSAIREALYIAGYTEVGGQMYGPDGAALTSLPTEEPVQALDLGHGYRLLPAAEVGEPTPEGRMLAGREPVILSDRVELRPVWVDIPPPPDPPSLEAVRSAKRSEVQAEKVRRRDAGFLVDGMLFDSDLSARTAYLEIAIKLSRDHEFSTPWKASEGQWVTMDADLFSLVEVAGTAHVAAAFAWQAGMDAQIDACTTVDEAQALEVSHA